MIFISSQLETTASNPKTYSGFQLMLSWKQKELESLHEATSGIFSPAQQQLLLQEKLLSILNGNLKICLSGFETGRWRGKSCCYSVKKYNFGVLTDCFINKRGIGSLKWML